MGTKKTLNPSRRYGSRIVPAGLVVLAILWIAHAPGYAQEATGNPAEQWEKMTPQEREALRERYRAFKRLKREQQQEILRNLDQFRTMTPEERHHILDNHSEFRRLSPDERQALNRNFQRWRKLPPERRDQLRNNYRRYLRMTPDERKRFMENYRIWEKLTPEQRSRFRRQHPPGSRSGIPLPRKRPDEKP